VPTCLVTGGAGFLGSHLCDELLARGHRVICVDNLETGSLKNIEHIRDPERFLHLNLDIIEPYHVDEPVDFVYHLASPASPIDYLRLPLHTLKVGSYGTHHTLGVAKHKRARFLLASTSEVYGDPLEHPQPESYWGHVNPIGPRGVYDEAKRYAEALTMAYHRQQGVDTSIVRIFNSILADEQVLYDDGTELRREPVEQAAERLAPFARITAPAAAFVPRAGSVATAAQPALVYRLRGCTVPAFGARGRMLAREASHLIAHPTDARCFEVKTRYGRSIRVTGDHSIFAEGPRGEPQAVPVRDLEVGDVVAIARRAEVRVRDRTEVSLLDVWARAELDPWDLVVESKGLGDLAWARRHELFGMLVSERRNSGPNWRNGTWTRLIRMRQSDRVPLPVLRRLRDSLPSGARARAKHARALLPTTIHLTNSLLWLLGLWVAEGSWAESATAGYITFSCEEPVLRRAQEIIERELGLHVVFSRRNASRTAAIFVHSRLLLRVMEHLGFGPLRKRIPGWILGLPLERLKWFLEGYREGDGVHSGMRLEEGIRHAFVTTSTELKDDLIVALARFGLVPSVGHYTTRIKKKTGNRRYPFWAITLCNVSPWSPLRWDEGVSQQLNARVTGDLVWARITSIEEVEPTPLVYDFSVPGCENFWAGSGVMARNTYGPRMRPHDGRAIPTFLRQALANRPLTVFGDGSQTRSFCFVSDEIRGIIALAESGYHDPVNVGNPDEFTLLELAEAVKEVTGSSSDIVYEALPEDDPKQRQPDVTLARELLGWSPEVPLKEGLQRTIDASGVELLIGGNPS
jgi:UDP-glucuronate decarboxylase